MAGGVAEGAVSLEGELKEPVAEEDDLLGPTEHPEIRRQSQLQRVLPHQAIAKGVKGGDLDVGVPVRDQGVDALFHLGSGLLREREGQDLLRAGLAVSNEVRDAAGDDGGLAGTGTGHDE